MHLAKLKELSFSKLKTLQLAIGIAWYSNQPDLSISFSLLLSLSRLRLTLAELPVSDCEKAVLVAKVGCLVVMVSPFLAGSRSALAKPEKIYIYFFSSRLSFALKVAAAVLLNQPLQRSSDSSPHVMVCGGEERLS